MTEPDYVWLTNDSIDPPPVIRVIAGSEWHYYAGGWHDTDPVPELTAADIEAAQAAADVNAEVEEAEAEAADDENNLAAELAEDEQEPDPETPAQEES